MGVGGRKKATRRTRKIKETKRRGSETETSPPAERGGRKMVDATTNGATTAREKAGRGRNQMATTNARRATKTPATTARRRKQMEETVGGPTSQKPPAAARRNGETPATVGGRASKLPKEPTGGNAAAPGEARTRKAHEATQGRGTSLVEAVGGGTPEAEAPAARRGRVVDHRTRNGGATTATTTGIRTK